MNRRIALSSIISGLCSLRIFAFGNREFKHQAQTEKNSHGFTLRKFTVPFYSPMARQVGIEGRASVVVNVSKEGSVTSVVEFNGNPLFQTPVTDALKEWRFEPLTDHTGQLRITFQFVLKGDRDQRILNYKVSGTLPSDFEIEVNPFANNL